MSVRTVALSAALSTVLALASTFAQSACEGTNPEFCRKMTIGGALADLHEIGSRSSLSGSADPNAGSVFATRGRILNFDEESVQPRKRVQFYLEFEDEIARQGMLHQRIMNETDQFNFDETESTYDKRNVRSGFRVKF